MYDKTPLEELQPGDAIIIPHPASDAYVLARVVNLTKRGARVNYWSSRLGDWGTDERTRFIDRAHLIAPGAEFQKVSEKLQDAFMAMHNELRAVRDKHLQAVSDIAGAAAQVSA